jgi:flavorubredoxin
VTNFLIAFAATEEFTEGLALALGLGAVQRGGSIRLRHLSPPESTHLAHQGYGRIKVEDLAWAECLAVGIEPAEPNADLEELLRVVRAFPDRDALAAKRAVVFGSDVGRGSAVGYVREALREAGMGLIEEHAALPELSAERMMLVGNRLAEMD